MVVDEKYDLLKGICDTSNAMDMDELAFSLVALFLHNGNALPMIKWAIKQEIKSSSMFLSLLPSPSSFLPLFLLPLLLPSPTPPSSSPFTPLLSLFHHFLSFLRASLSRLFSPINPLYICLFIFLPFPVPF